MLILAENEELQVNSIMSLASEDISNYYHIFTSMRCNYVKRMSLRIAAVGAFNNKEVLLRERKRHTARRIAIASGCYSGGVPFPVWPVNYMVNIMFSHPSDVVGNRRVKVLYVVIIGGSLESP